MKTVKGKLSLLIILMLLIFIFPITLKASSNVLTLSNTEFGAIRGEEFTTTLYVEEGSDVSGLTVTLTYDSTLVTLKSWESIEAGIVNVVDNNIIIAYSSANNVTKQLDLLTLTFEVNEQIGVGKYNKWLTLTDSSLYIQTNFTSIHIRAKGDAYNNKGDGKVNARDASYILQHVARMFTMNSVDQYYANVFEDYDSQGNPKINTRDASMILQYIAKMNAELDSRYEVIFYTLNENNEYVEYIKKSVKKGEAIINIPDGEWSLSSEELIEVDFSKITSDLKVYKQKHTHTEEIIPAVEATCTTTGLTTGIKCSECNEVLVAQEVVKAKGHDWNEGVVTTNPTCTATGVKTYTCKYDSSHTYTEVVEALGHNYEGVVTTHPACTATGVKTVTCKNDASHTYTEVVEALGHIAEVLSKVEAKCTKAGLTEGSKCKKCNEILVYQTIIEMTGHTFIDNRCILCGEYEGSEGLEFKLLNDDTYEVVSIGTCTTTDIVIPSILNNKLVTSIGKDAFYNTNITSIKIPSTIKTMKGQCFETNSLTKVYYEGTIEDWCNIEFLSNGGFVGCVSPMYRAKEFYMLDNNNNWYEVKEIEIPNTITEIGKYQFFGFRNISSIKIPNSITSIGEYAFYNCTSLESITIPNSVTSIGSYAFDNCTSLVSIEIPNSVTSIGSYAFSSCENLERVVIPNSVKSIGTYAFFRCTSLVSIEIPNSVTKIEEGTFYNCTSLVSIEIPNSITSISSEAFRNCTRLESIVIPSSVRSVGSDAFKGCANLTLYCELNEKPSNWNEDWNSSNYIVVWGYNDNIEHICDFDETTFIPSTCLKKGYRECKCNICGAHYTEELPLTNHNFVDEKCIVCSLPIQSNGLEFKLLNDDTYEVVSIGTCTTTDIVIPSILNNKLVTSIGKDAFYNTNITSIKIPSTIKTMKGQCFETNSLTKVYYEGTIEDWCNIEFLSNGGFVGCVSPMYRAKEFYMLDNNNNWYEVKEIEIPNTITEIGKYQFFGFRNISSIKIPNSITSIGEYAFYNCTSLESITIPNSVTSIGSYAFDNCTSLVSIEIPNSVTSIGSYAFSSCENLERVVIPNSVKSIGTYAFFRCTSLVSIEIPNSVTKIEEGTFYNCTSLVSIEIPNSITSISSEAFRNCTRLESIVIPSSVRSIGSNAFKGCANLTLYCEVDTQPSNWNEYWNSSNCTVVWGYNDNIEHICINIKYISTIQPTCKEQGYDIYRCITCNEIISKNYKAALGHDYSEEVIAPTCTSDGFTTYSCTRCNDSYVKDYKNALGHNEVNHVGKEATCTESGYKPYVTCTRCTYSTYQTIDSLGHNEINHEGKEATCTESGYKPYVTCTRCTYSTYQTINELGHNYVGIQCNKCKEYKYSKGLSYVLLDNDTYKVTGIGSCTDDIIIIPSTYNEKEVTVIGQFAFSGEEKITRVILPETIVSIEMDAFYNCELLTEINLPNSIQSIAKSTFSGCISLKTVDLPDNITVIDSYLFYRCSSLTSIVIPQNVTIIKESAFDYCTGLETVTILGPVTTIENSVFYRCEKLKSIDLGDSLETLGYKAFNCCMSLEEIIFPNTMKSIGECAFDYCIKLKSVHLGSSFQEIGHQAFVSCISLETIIIPQSVTHIERYAFRDCVNLVIYCEATSKPSKWNPDWNEYNCPVIWDCNGEQIHVCFGDNYIRKVSPTCTNVGYDVYECEFCKEEYNKNEVASIGHNLVNHDSKEPTCTEVGNNSYVTCTRCDYSTYEEIGSLGHNTQQHEGKAATCLKGGYKPYVTCTRCTYSTYQTINALGHNYSGDQCTRCQAYKPTETLYYILLSDDTYSVTGGENCNLETVISIPNTYNNKPVTRIEGYAFSDYTNLQQIIIPDSILSIGEYALSGCTNLRKVVMPEGVKTIENYAFKESAGMTEITIPSTVTSIGIDSFSSCTYLNSVYYTGTISDWCNISFGSLNANPMARANYFYMLDNNQNWYEVTELVIPNDVTEIKDYQFQGFDRVSNVILPNNVTSIGAFAFYNCINIISIDMSNTVHTIGQNAFNRCIKLEEVNIPTNVTKIEDYAFSSCDSLKEINLHENIEEIGIHAFSYCYSVTELVIPGNVKKIGNSAFLYCSSLKEIIIEEGVEEIDGMAFQQCEGLDTIFIPSTVTVIKSLAFSNCTELNDVYYGGTIEQWINISFDGSESNPMNYAEKFYILDNDNWNEVTEIKLSNSVTKIGSYQFYGFDNLEYIIIPSSVITIGASAFKECTSLTIYCETSSKPTTWDSTWNSSNRTVVWNCLNSSTHNCFGNEFIETVLPSCIEQGYDKYLCVICNRTYSTNFVDAVGHTEIVDAKVEASCTTTGLTEGKHCSGCNKIFVEQELIPLMDHNYINKICSVCNAMKPSEGLKYTLLNDGTYEVSGIGTCTDANIIIPSFYNGVPVTSVGQEAFYYNSKITDVFIPEGITNIGMWAFRGCNKIKNVTLPSSVVSIGESAFYNNSGIENMYYQGTLQSLILLLCTDFADSSITRTVSHIYTKENVDIKALETITIPNGVTCIKDGAFQNCTSFVSIEIPESVNEIEGFSFSGCTSLNSIVIPSSVTSIGYGAFDKCKNLESVYYQGSLEEIIILLCEYSDCTLNFYDAHIYTKDGVDVKSLTSIEIPNSVTRISDQAFYNYTNLLSVEIPNSVTTIGAYAFYECEKLTIYCETNRKLSGWNENWNASNCSVIWDYKNTTGHVCVKESDFSIVPSTCILMGYDLYICKVCGKEIKTNYKYLLEHIYEDGVCKICDAPLPSEGLEYDLLLDDTYEVVGIGSCEDVNIVIPSFYNGKPVTGIGESAFISNENVASVTMPNSISFIGGYAFANCSNLQKITISSHIDAIGYLAFANCVCLENIHYQGTLDELIILLCDNSDTDLLENVKHIYTIDNIDFKSLTTVKIPEGVRKITENLFSNCPNLKVVQIPDSVYYISSFAFYNCTSLESILIPEGITGIGNCAFEGCINLTIYCEAVNKPSGWIEYWNSSNCPVVWGYNE